MDDKLYIDYEGKGKWVECKIVKYEIMSGYSGCVVSINGCEFWAYVDDVKSRNGLKEKFNYLKKEIQKIIDMDILDAEDIR